MNATITTTRHEILTGTDGVTSDDVDATAGRRTGRSGRSGRLLRVVAAALVGVLGVVGFTAHQADAMIIGPTPVPNVAGSVDAEIYCSPGYFSITAYTSVQAGYLNGQTVSWRYYIENNQGFRQYSNWSSNVVLPNLNYLRQRITLPAVRKAVSGVTWTAKVQVAYWTPSGWSLSNWHTAGKKQAGYSDWMKNCWT